MDRDQQSCVDAESEGGRARAMPGFGGGSADGRGEECRGVYPLPHRDSCMKRGRSAK